MVKEKYKFIIRFKAVSLWNYMKGKCGYERSKY